MELADSMRIKLHTALVPIRVLRFIGQYAAVMEGLISASAFFKATLVVYVNESMCSTAGTVVSLSVLVVVVMLLKSPSLAH